MSLRLGSLFAGYGGLDLAVSSVLDAEPVWFSEFDKGPSKILAHRFPGVPNHGDITKIDWFAVEPVDILTGGSPCQDLSHAGRRAGMTEGTRSNLWVAMREAIAQLRPGLVVWENVRGAYSAAADSEVEPCPGCVGDRPTVHLRALGRVLGDLSELGYDCRWHGLRAADVGAPHGRFRVFVVATDTQGDAGRLARGDGGTAAIASGLRRGARRTAEPREAPGGRTPTHIAGRGLLPTPRATDGTKGGPGQRGSSGDLMLPSAVAMLPTPQARDFKGYGPADGNRNDPNLSAIPLLLPAPRVTQPGYADDGRGGRSLDVEARLLPTPRTQNNENRQSEGYGGEGGNFHGLIHNPERWGDYAPAIARWEHVLGRPAPEPTQTSKKGNPQLSARFVEWLMGLPEGWVTDVPGITRNEALKALGNGVVSQQAAEALRTMLAWEVAA